MSDFTIEGNLIDLFDRKIFPARIDIEQGKIKSVTEIAEPGQNYILPGFIDAHVHIESSMLTPAAFARLAVVHGTVATVSDPHEIANVCGLEGIRFMIENSKKTPFKIFFGAPSCVPATFFETAGAVINSKDIEELMASPDIWYLAEMMNFPGVLHQDREVTAKIKAAQKSGKPVDGHAPGLKGAEAARYAGAGITTDHESFTKEEALDKIKAGMHCLIREGSAAKNFDALIELIAAYPEKIMFCSDDKHPDELAMHHIDELVRRAVKKGYDLFDVLRAACVNPVIHYKIPVGLLRPGDPADFIVVNNPDEFRVLETVINGQTVAKNGKTFLKDVAVTPINNFKAKPVKPEIFRLKAQAEKIRVIEAIEGQLITRELIAEPNIEEGFITGNSQQDILKIAVINRYVEYAKPAIGFIKNLGLKTGAIASTIAHDCHNIIVAGADDASIAAAVNALIKHKGGISVAENTGEVSVLPLPVAGLMSDGDGFKLAEAYSEIDRKAKELGTPLKAPFMTLSFMALLVIPALKLSDKGLFNGNAFEFTDIFTKGGYSSLNPQTGAGKSGTN